jgi:hypothetical protein
MRTLVPAAKAELMNSPKNPNASRHARLVAVLISVVWLGACERGPAGPAAEVPQTPVAERAADGAVAVAACTQDCGDGLSASIQCAAGEIADCSCTDGARARCLPRDAEP